MSKVLKSHNFDFGLDFIQLKTTNKQKTTNIDASC